MSEREKRRPSLLPVSKNRTVNSISKNDGHSTDVFPTDFDDVLADLPGLPDLYKAGSKKTMDPGSVEALKVFRDTVKRLKEQAGGEAEDFRSDTSAKVMYQSLLATTYEMIPTAVEKYLTEKNESAAYAYNALANQLKDLQNALKGLESLEDQAEYITARILAPNHVQLMQNLISGLMLIKSELDTMGFREGPVQRLREKLDNMVRGHVGYMEAQNRAITAQVKAYLLGEDLNKPTTPVKKVRKSKVAEDA